jgi:molecular chaperone GrpE
MEEMNEKDLIESENQPLEAETNINSAENTVQHLEAELKEQKEKYLRIFAEFENYKKRTSKEKLELHLTAGKELMVALLDVMDDCDRAETQVKSFDNIEATREGVLLVFNKLRSVLQQKGLVKMNSLHEDFDVEKHEAITEIEVPEELKGKVIDDLIKGYYLNDKIIRFAKVVVGK